jgi:hypothetical protein
MFYLDLFKCLAKHRVRYLLVGGLAMNLHGVPRMTMDVDIVLALDEQNLKLFLDAARELKLKPSVPVEMEDLLNADLRKLWAREKNMIAFPLAPSDPMGPTIDILIDPPFDVESALAGAEHRSLGDVSVPVASIEDMIRLKENTGRAQDRADIEHLNRIKRM